MALIVAACGGDDDDGAASSPTTDPNRDLLAQMVLRLEDLPSGMQDVGGTYTTNEQAAEGASDPAAALRQFETWGRVLGLSQTFILGPEAPPDRTVLGVQSDANLYEESQGASFSHSSDVEESRAADWASAFPQLEQVEVTELDGSGLGDDAYWLRVSGISAGEPRTLMVIDQVAFRVDRVRGYLRVDAEFPPETPRDTNQDQVREWVELSASRMRATLAAGS